MYAHVESMICKKLLVDFCMTLFSCFLCFVALTLGGFRLFEQFLLVIGTSLFEQNTQINTI